jgi:hypothetical protein
VEDRETEARAALDRVERDTETLGTSAMARGAGWRGRLKHHFGGEDAIGAGEGGTTDPIEVWGRRIGRGLSLVGVVVLGFWLAMQLRLFG